MKQTCLLVSMVLLMVGGDAFSAQLPPAADLLPSGFQIVNEFAQEGVQVLEATHQNSNYPPSGADLGITLNVGWQVNPMAGMMLEYIMDAPESPPSALGLTKDEPCGKSRYRGGILTCRKNTIPWEGEMPGTDVVTWSLVWQTSTDTGLLGVSMHNFYGSREGATSLIDSVIDKLTYPH